MDTQTRHALKGDKFAQATKTSVTWLSGHRSNVVRWAIGAAVVLVVGIGFLVFWNVQQGGAEQALGQALDIYTAPLALPGGPAEPGTYATVADRAKAANAQFKAVADKYGWLTEGSKARYFQGVTEQELGQTSAAEGDLKKVADSWNRNLANLAKVALASIYRQTGRDQQAIDLYNEIIAKPSQTVSAGVAQLDLADLYDATGKQGQAKALWAKIKDSDKEGAAGSIAAQKLAGNK
ncbi:tetratricopeptide repeat protein [Occallatibacter savannae]|uniref:tetratricopeptide repeat protein n=1 Tax=Occallatibacter savannae TaxID=1002691 RepID=UPI000D6951EE|nr:tetratricopeptide repeat protein [Occallatibacter savannae]